MFMLINMTLALLYYLLTHFIAIMEHFRSHHKILQRRGTDKVCM